MYFLWVVQLFSPLFILVFQVCSLHFLDRRIPDRNPVPVVNMGYICSVSYLFLGTKVFKHCFYWIFAFLAYLLSSLYTEETFNLFDLTSSDNWASKRLSQFDTHLSIQQTYTGKPLCKTLLPEHVHVVSIFRFGVQVHKSFSTT